MWYLIWIPKDSRINWRGHFLFLFHLVHICIFLVLLISELFIYWTIFEAFEFGLLCLKICLVALSIHLKNSKWTLICVCDYNPLISWRKTNHGFWCERLMHSPVPVAHISPLLDQLAPDRPVAVLHGSFWLTWATPVLTFHFYFIHLSHVISMVKVSHFVSGIMH